MPDIPLTQIQPNRLNPRQHFSPAVLDDLARSIRQYGILEPIVVRPENSHYEVVVGERRYHAAQQAGLDAVPVIIRNYSDEEVVEITLVENVQRDDLSAVEKAKLCRELRTRFGHRYPNWEAISGRIGVEPETVRAWLRTLDLPEPIQVRIAPREGQRRVPEGKIDYQTALRVAEKIKDPGRQIEVVERLVEKKVPHRVANEIIRRAALDPNADLNGTSAITPRAAAQSLSFSHRSYRQILDGTKTQTTRRRLEPSCAPGSNVSASVSRFGELHIEEVIRKRMREITEDDARREGARSLAEFREQWRRQYGCWDEDEVVYLLRFCVARLA
jgi:ParB family chromosome partitioning protein